MLAFYGLTIATTNYRGTQCKHMAYGIHCFFRLTFLQKTDNSIDNHHGNDDRGIHNMTQHRCNGSGAQKDIYKDIVEMKDKAQHNISTLGFWQLIETKFKQPFVCIGLT